MSDPKSVTAATAATAATVTCDYTCECYVCCEPDLLVDNRCLVHGADSSYITDTDPDQCKCTRIMTKRTS